MPHHISGMERERDVPAADREAGVGAEEPLVADVGLIVVSGLYREKGVSRSALTTLISRSSASCANSREYCGEVNPSPSPLNLTTRSSGKEPRPAPACALAGGGVHPRAVIPAVPVCRKCRRLTVFM